MVTLTDKAKEHIFEFMQKHENLLGIRISVNTAGCSGLSYKIELCTGVDITDHVFGDMDVSVIIDEKSLVYMDGTEIDFVVEGLNSGLKLNNPLAKDECGCGKTFTT